MPFFAITGLINAIGSICIGLFVYFEKKKDFVNRIFALMCFSIAIWSFSYYFWQISDTRNSALFWSKALMMGAIFIPATYLHFVFAFLDLTRKRKHFIIFSYIIAFIFVIFDLTSKFVKDVEPALYFPYWPKPGIAYHFFLFIFFSYMIYGCYLLFRTQQRTKGLQQIQLKYIFVASLIGLFGGTTNYFLWYGIPIPPFGNALIIFYPIFIAYAITKHHLFNIKVILTELLVGIMGIILLFLPFIISIPAVRILTIGIFFLFCVFGYYLIKAAYDEIKRREEAERFRIVSVNLKENLSRVLDLQEIILRISNALMKAFEIQNVGFALKEPSSMFYQIQGDMGFSDKELGSLIKDTNLCLYLQEAKKPLTENDFVAKNEELKVVKDKILKNKISVLLPLFQKENLIGVVFLGNKISGSPFSNEDVYLLEVLSYQVSVSINNALLYEEIKKDKAVLEKFYKLTVGREVKMAELKQKIAELEEKLITKE